MERRAKNGRRNQKACTGCRQVKLRCDSVQTFPAACSRCQKNNIQCRTDPGFKRMPARNAFRRLEEVTTQLNEVQANFTTRLPNTTPGNLAHTEALPHSENTCQATELLHDTHGGFPQFYPLDDLPDLPCLGQIILESIQTKSLFEHFGLNYYRHCPILDTEVSVKGLHQTSPVLFWTITIIACRWHVSLSYLYDSLLEPYRSLLGRILVEPIHSIESIQAIALRCFWPLSVPRQVDDPSWNHCGFLTNAAMKMGLNKAQRDFQATAPKSTVGIRILAWIACVQANCANGWTSGVAVSAEVLTKFTIAPPLPTRVERDFALKVQIMQKTENSCSTLTSLRENLSSWAFVQSQCRDLDTLRDAYGNEELWTAEMDVLTFGGQLRLYMLQLERGEILQSVSQAVGDQDNASSQLSFINLAYMTATQLVHSFSSMLEGAKSHNTDTRSPQRHFPKHYFGLLLLAMAFLFKVKVFHAQEVTSSQNRTDTSLRTVYEILSSWSGGELDEPGRAIRLMDVLARNEKEFELKLKESTSEGRQGLAILDDLISTAKTIRERAQTTTEITSSDNNQMVDHVPGLDTDLALLEGWQDSLLDWNFPWGLELPWGDPYDFDIGTT